MIHPTAVWVDGADGKADTILKVDVGSDSDCGDSAGSGSGSGSGPGSGSGADAGAEAGAFFEPFLPRAILHFQMLVFYCFACFALLCFVLCCFDFACVCLFSEKGCDEGCEDSKGGRRHERPPPRVYIRRENVGVYISENVAEGSKRGTSSFLRGDWNLN